MNWSKALKVTGSKGGSYVIEYLFYTLFSVSAAESFGVEQPFDM